MGRERESMNEEIRGRPQWNQVELCNWAWETEMSRQNRKECDQISRTEVRILSVLRERRICLWKSEEEMAILLGYSSIFNQQSTRTVNDWAAILKNRQNSREHCFIDTCNQSKNFLPPTDWLSKRFIRSRCCVSETHFGEAREYIRLWSIISSISW